MQNFNSDLLVRRVGGTVLVVDRAGVLRGLDLETGMQRWAAPPPSDSLIPAIASPDFVASRRSSRTPDDSLEWLGLPDGGLILTSGLTNTEDLPITDRLRVHDPRTGQLTEHAVGKLMSSSVHAVPADGPEEITAETATAAVAPRVPVLWPVLRQGRGRRPHPPHRPRRDPRARRDRHPGRLGPEAPHVRRRRPQRRGGLRPPHRQAARPPLRREGRHLRSEGERLVIADDGRDYVVKP